MQTLPEINKQIQDLESQLKNLSDIFQDLEEAEQHQVLDSLSESFLQAGEQRQDKVNAWCWVILRKLSEAEYYRGQKERFAQLERSTTNFATKMKSYLLEVVQQAGGKLPTKDFPKLASRTASVPPVIIDSDYEGDIPQEFLKAPELNKTTVREALKAGEYVPFAKFGEKSRYLAGLK